jgi:class 3 adenylate cyclase
MEPTAIGDSVNLASRTESLCKQYVSQSQVVTLRYGARLLITEYTLEHLGLKAEDFVIRTVDHVEVKGKNKGL